VLRSPTGKHWVQSAVHIAIMARLGVYSKRGQFPLRAAAGRRDHDRLAGAPDSGAAAYLLRSGPFASVLQGPSANARRVAAARPGSAISGGKSLRPGTMRHLRRACFEPRHRTGPAEAPLAQANQAPPETDYGTQPNTERSYGMSTNTTSARAQCKGSSGGSSCGIAHALGVTRSVRGSEP
jgi:hypothetical protein